MNIFVTSPDPQSCARFLDDKRVNKMILESAQLLNNAIHLHGGEAYYRTTHLGHPCTKWVAERRANALWLFTHFGCLLGEFELRNGKDHACGELYYTIRDQLDLFPMGLRTPFVNCTPYKDLPVFDAYRKHLHVKWSEDVRTPTWFGKTAEYKGPDIEILKKLDICHLTVVR